MASDTTIAPLNTAAPAGKSKIRGARLKGKGAGDLTAPAAGRPMVWDVDEEGLATPARRKATGVRLTDKVVRELPAPSSGNRITYCADMPGFGCRVTSSGKGRAFVLNYRAAGRERRFTIGDFPAWTVTQARKRAEELRREVDSGGDPMARREDIRNAPTINTLADRFEAEHLTKRRAGTVGEYLAIIRAYIRPVLGGMKVSALRHADVERLHASIAARAPYRANRTIAVLSKMLSLAVKWEMRLDNPARGVERAPEHKRERFLTPAEIARLGEVLASHPEKATANAVRLLLLTGARRGEVLGATWNQFDLDTGVWTKPAATTKQNKEHRLPLSAPTRQLLAEMKTEADTENERRRRFSMPDLIHIFPGKDGKPLQDIKKLWASVCAKAGIEGVRVHDLRHTYAAILASAGLSLPIIGQLLGHTQAQTTARYAHLMDDPLRAATERAGAVIMGAGTAGAEVVSITARRGR